MGKITGFLEIDRAKAKYRPVEERLKDWREVTVSQGTPVLREQGARCMDCSIPFCHQGCPLGNLIPDWNDLVYRGQWQDALTALHSTNNFPEFTGHICPAPCEAACTLNFNDQPVTIKYTELAIVERGWAEGWIKPEPATKQSGFKVAVIGCGHLGTIHARLLAARADAELVAALVHDVGKGRLATCHRIAFVLLNAGAPSLARRLEAERGAGWRQALWRLRHQVQFDMESVKHPKQQKLNNLRLFPLMYQRI